MCKPGYCANGQGKCEQGQGKRLGSYAIRFSNAHQQDQPYLGLEDDTVSSTANSMKQWNLALTPDGFVRFENIHKPGDVLTIHRVIRMTLMATSTNRTAGSNLINQTLVASERHRSQIPDDDYLYPELNWFDSATPAEVSFQVREIPDEGLEIWDPYRKVSIASAKKGSFFKDRVADLGVAECYPESIGLGKCEGRQLVVFEPELPAGVATVGVERTYREAPGLSPFNEYVLNKTVDVVLVICSIALLVFVYFIFSGR